MKTYRNRFYCCLTDENSRHPVATSIPVNVPLGLTREQVFDYCTGRIVRELERYAVQEALGLTVSTKDTDWDEIVS